MSDYPQTNEEIINRLRIINLEYVRDISLQCHYGLGLRAKCIIDGENVSVLGSLVLNSKTGEPLVENEGTSFHAYPNGLENDSVILVKGQEAVETMENIYKNVKSDNNPFKPEDQVNIKPDAY